MLAVVLTVRGLAIFNHGVAAPLWRMLVTLDNAVWLNLFAAVVVAGCFTYSVRNFVFKLGPLYDELLVGVWGKVAIALVAVSFFVIPGFASEIASVSPFFFSLMPGAISLALLASQIEGLDARLAPCEEEEPVFDLRGLNWRLFLSGVFAAIGTWEGVIGAGLAFIVMTLTFEPRVRLERTFSKVLLIWVLGYLLSFGVEGLLLGWPWASIRPMRPPYMAIAVFALVALAPVAVIRFKSSRPWIVILWGVVLVVMGTSVLIDGNYWRPSACERFARKVLADLGERKIIIGDGLTDDFFRVLKPSDVRLVGARSVEDREFLLACLNESETLEKRALVVRQYYRRLPVVMEMMPELGYRATKQVSPEEEARKLRSLTPDQQKAVRGLIATNALARVMAVSAPVVKVVQEMMESFEKIPPKQRRVKIEAARETIRQGWVNGLEGPGLSSTILALDIMLGDWADAESDALTALMVDQDDPAANAMMGNIRLRRGEFETAEKYLLKGMAGGGVSAYNDMAMLMLLTKRTQEAMEWARKALAKAPNDWNCHETMAQILVARQEAIEAQKELDIAERLAKQQGQFDNGRESFRKARAAILRLRGKFANELWGQDSSDRWGE